MLPDLVLPAKENWMDRKMVFLVRSMIINRTATTPSGNGSGSSNSSASLIPTYRNFSVFHIHFL